MMNDTYKNFFKPFRGLRQGDPLSPYLFIIMEEVLSRLLKNRFEDGSIGRFYHPRGAHLISHLLYADDLLIFSNGDSRAGSSIRQIRQLPKAPIGRRPPKKVLDS